MDTIKAKKFYRVCNLKKEGQMWGQASFWFTEEEAQHLCMVLDGDEPIMVACLRSFDDYTAELKGNECFHFCERFTTRKGNQFIYWRDEETDTDYITKVV